MRKKKRSKKKQQLSSWNILGLVVLLTLIVYQNCAPVNFGNTPDDKTDPGVVAQGEKAPHLRIEVRNGNNELIPQGGDMPPEQQCTCRTTPTPQNPSPTCEGMHTVKLSLFSDKPVVTYLCRETQPHAANDFSNCMQLGLSAASHSLHVIDDMTAIKTWNGLANDYYKLVTEAEGSNGLISNEEVASFKVGSPKCDPSLYCPGDEPMDGCGHKCPQGTKDCGPATPTPPVAKFTINPQDAQSNYIVGETIQVIDQSQPGNSGPITAYQWDFDYDLANQHFTIDSTERNPSAFSLMPISGRTQRVIALKVIDAKGLSDTVWKTINVIDPQIVAPSYLGIRLSGIFAPPEEAGHILPGTGPWDVTLNSLLSERYSVKIELVPNGATGTTKFSLSQKDGSSRIVLPEAGKPSAKVSELTSTSVTLKATIKSTTYLTTRTLSVPIVTFLQSPAAEKPKHIFDSAGGSTVVGILNGKNLKIPSQNYRKAFVHSAQKTELAYDILSGPTSTVDSTMTVQIKNLDHILSSEKESADITGDGVPDEFVDIDLDYGGSSPRDLVESVEDIRLLLKKGSQPPITPPVAKFVITPVDDTTFFVNDTYGLKSNSEAKTFNIKRYEWDLDYNGGQFRPSSYTGPVVPANLHFPSTARTLKIAHRVFDLNDNVSNIAVKEITLNNAPEFVVGSVPAYLGTAMAGEFSANQSLKHRLLITGPWLINLNNVPGGFTTTFVGSGDVGDHKFCVEKVTDKQVKISIPGPELSNILTTDLYSDGKAYVAIDAKVTRAGHTDRKVTVQIPVSTFGDTGSSIRHLFDPTSIDPNKDSIDVILKGFNLDLASKKSALKAVASTNGAVLNTLVLTAPTTGDSQITARVFGINAFQPKQAYDFDRDCLKDEYLDLSFEIGGAAASASYVGAKNEIRVITRHLPPEILPTATNFSISPNDTHFFMGENILLSGQGTVGSCGLAQYQWDTNYNPANGFQVKYSGQTLNYKIPTYSFLEDKIKIAMRVVDTKGYASNIIVKEIWIHSAPIMTIPRYVGTNMNGLYRHSSADQYLAIGAYSAEDSTSAVSLNYAPTGIQTTFRKTAGSWGPTAEGRNRFDLQQMSSKLAKIYVPGSEFQTAKTTDLGPNFDLKLVADYKTVTRTLTSKEQVVPIVTYIKAQKNEIPAVNSYAQLVYTGANLHLLNFEHENEPYYFKPAVGVDRCNATANQEIPVVSFSRGGTGIVTTMTVKVALGGIWGDPNFMCKGKDTGMMYYMLDLSLAPRQIGIYVGADTDFRVPAK